MERRPRYSAQRALQLLFDLHESEEDDEETNNDREDYDYGDRVFGDGDTMHFEPEDGIVDDYEGDIDVVSEHSSSEDSDDENDANFREQTSDMEANGIHYSREPFENRRRQRNIVEDGPRNLAHPRSALEAFHLFFTPEMTREILRHTNRKACDVRRESQIVRGFMSNFTYDEICACIGIILRAGLDRDNMTDIGDLWNAVEGRPFFRAVIAQKRFVFFLRCIRFDNYRTRPQRLKDDRLAAVSSMWEQFIGNLRRHYIPNETLTVDEQLVGYRGYIPGRTYLPSKPAKYGLKIFWLTESRTGFALNAKIYTGKDQSGTHRNLGRDIVMELSAPYHHTGREIVSDNYFTSHNSAT